MPRIAPEKQAPQTDVIVDKWISALDAVAAVTGTPISKWTIRRWCKRGIARRRDGGRIRLRHRIVGARYMTTVADVREFFDRLTADRQEASGISPAAARRERARPASTSLYDHYPEWSITDAKEGA